MGLDFDVSLLNGNVKRGIEADADWFDPIIGITGSYAYNDRRSAYGFADLGGFGIEGSSSLTWQAYGGVNYAFAQSLAGNLGYRYMAIDYEDEINLNIDLSGPVLGLTWRF